MSMGRSRNPTYGSPSMILGRVAPQTTTPTATSATPNSDRKGFGQIPIEHTEHGGGSSKATRSNPTPPVSRRPAVRILRPSRTRFERPADSIQLRAATDGYRDQLLPG